MLQQAHEHKKNSRTKKKKGRISRTTHNAKFIVLLFDGFHVTENKVVVFCCWWSSRAIVILPLKVSSILYFLILKKLLASARLFITYQEASHVSVHNFSHNTGMV